MSAQWREVLELGIVGAAVIAIGGSMATQRIAFAQAAPLFEVAPVAAPSPVNYSARGVRTPQRIAFQSTRVGDVMAFAYGLPLDRIERRPQWMYDDLYDVAMTTADPTSLPEQKLLLQKLLEKRFGLAVHRVSNESTVYYLVPLGAKVYFTETKEAETADIPQFRVSSPRPSLQPGEPGLPFSNVCIAKHVAMSDLAEWLYLQVGLPVIDKTGLTGFFDMEISGLPIRGGAEGTIRAVRNALGLDLESHRGTAESLIIDHTERPSRD